MASLSQLGRRLTRNIGRELGNVGRIVGGLFGLGGVPQQAANPPLTSSGQPGILQPGTGIVMLPGEDIVAYRARIERERQQRQPRTPTGLRLTAARARGISRSIATTPLGVQPPSSGILRRSAGNAGMGQI